MGCGLLLLLAEGMAVSSRLSHKLAGKEDTEDFCVVKLPVGEH